MQNYIATSGSCVGFGEDKESAEADLHLNLCHKDLSYDTSGEFLKRKEQLQAWNPQSNMLHVSDIGCLIYENGMIYETKTGRSVPVDRTGPAIYYYLARTFGEALSYSDIFIVMKDEVDTFFRNISDQITLLSDMPHIRAIEIEPLVVYSIADSYNIGVAGEFIGMQQKGSKVFYGTEVTSANSYMSLLSYIGYRLGVIFTGKGVKYASKELG